MHDTVINMQTTHASARAPFAIRVLRALSVTTVEPPKTVEDFHAGSGFSAAETVNTIYNPVRAASALVANPFYFRACKLRAEKVSALELQVQVRQDGKWVHDEQHPLNALFRHPNTGQTERQFREQLVFDFLPGGNAYILPMQQSNASGVPAGMVLLEPHRVGITPGPHGFAESFDYNEDGKKTRYAATQVVHIRGPSAASNLQRLFGTGEVQAMDRDIDADAKLASQMAKKAGKGRPDAAYVPRNPDKTWGAPQRKDMQRQVDRMLQEQTGGVAVMSGAGQFEMLDWTVEELGGIEARRFTRETVAAVTGVPPTMLASQAANYATSEMERVAFVKDALTPLAAMFDDAYTQLAHRAGFVNVRVRHIVPEMEDDRPTRIESATKHIANGMAPADAYQFEGFDDAPDLPTFGVDDNAPLPELGKQPETDEDTGPRMSEDTLAQAAALRELIAGSNDDDSDEDVDDEELREEVQVLLDSMARDEADSEPDEEEQ